MEGIFEEAKEALIEKEGEGSRALISAVPLKRGSLEHSPDFLGWTIGNRWYQEHNALAQAFWGEVLRICTREGIRRDVDGVYVGRHKGQRMYFRGYRFYGYDT